MSARHTLWLSVVVSGLAFSLSRAAEPPGPDPEVAFAERTLKDADIPTDGVGLLNFFRKRTLSPADIDKLARIIRRLGDDSFEAREKATEDLIAAGRPAVPFLKAALKDPDLEVARRAERCLDSIQQTPITALLTAASRLVADRKPVGAAEVLLAYLPMAEEELVEESLFASLAAVGLREGKADPALLAALNDKHTLRRAAAAYVVGRSSDPAQRKEALRLLTDTDPRVRFEAASTLVRSGERAAVPALLALLEDAPPAFGWRTEEILYRLAGDQAPTTNLGTGTEAERRKCRTAWEDWWKTYGPKVDLARLKQEEPLLGLTLVCEYDGAAGNGRVYELGKDGRARWEVSGLQGPNDAQLLPGGRVLVAERNGGKVTERDRKGTIVWQFAAPNSPISCQRLSNGNTLIATFNELFEVTPDGKKVQTHTHPHGFRHAVRLRNGNTLYVASNGQVVELDPTWKQVRAITPQAHGNGAGYWASVELLPTGRYLVVYGGAGKVVELDTDGKIRWEAEVQSAVFATRLRNGNTLVASFEGRALIELNRAGKEVEKTALQGRPFTIRRY
jgi:hypothetical protein